MSKELPMWPDTNNTLCFYIAGRFGSEFLVVRNLPYKLSCLAVVSTHYVRTSQSGFHEGMEFKTIRINVLVRDERISREKKPKNYL
jgi:hypothetical protein